MISKKIIVLLIFLVNISLIQAQLKGKIYHAAKSLADGKQKVVKLLPKDEEDAGNGIFINFKDSVSFSFYYLPNSANDCIWSYRGQYFVGAHSLLNLHFTDYNQRGSCKTESVKYKNSEKNFSYSAKKSGDTLILTRH